MTLWKLKGQNWFLGCEGCLFIQRGDGLSCGVGLVVFP